MTDSQLAPLADWSDMGHTEHFVQFYETDAFLVKSVASFIGAGLGAGDGAIVIATREHRVALEERLTAQGIDIKTVKAHGQFVALDANELLSQFMLGDMPDEILFNKVIGGLVEKISKGRSSVRAFGEMVALLWADGNHAGAIALEKLWNHLAGTHSFALFCAYPMNGFCGTKNGEAFLHVCGEHSRVLPAESYANGDHNADERLRAIASLQQKANSLELEIAGRKRVECELRHSKEELSSFVENASIGLHWVGPDGTILWANAAEYEMLGYTREEYIGRNIAEFYADSERIDEILKALRGGEQLRNAEARLKCKDGSVKTVLVDSSVLWEDGRFVHTQCFTRDITEQKIANEKLLHFAAIIQSSDDAIISKDLDGIITSWNDGARQMFGYTAEEVIGKPILILFPPDHVDEEPEILSRIRSGKRIDHYETVRQRKDGSRIEISLTISPIKNAAGKIIGASKIVRDITQRKRNERALEEARKKIAANNAELERIVAERTASLREVISQMEEFSYSVSHDLRSPLRAMQGYAAAVIEDFGNEIDPQARNYLERIVRNAGRMDRLVQDILTYSRVSRPEVKLQPVELSKLVPEIVRQYSEALSSHPKISIRRPLLSVVGHEPSLTQAISNLLQNAVKFVEPGTTPRVEIWTEPRGGFARLWIKDNGIGIKPEHQHRLFGMFQRIHPENKFEGTGIGLAIVRKAMERMGGKAGLESDGSHGSSFWIELPVALEP
jgi:PAS domain S-box-containing protein